MKKALVVLFFLSSVQLTFAQEKESQKLKRDVAKNGFYVDGLLALGTARVIYGQDYYAGEYNGMLNGIGLRFGSEWYWKKSDTRKIGLNIIWANTTFLLGNEAVFQLLPLNIGLSNIWSLNEKMAIEANFNVGYAVRFVGNTGQGIAINPEVKFRMGRTLFGLGYQFIYTTDSFYTAAYTHQLIVSVGLFQY